MGLKHTLQKIGKFLFSINDTVVREYPLDEQLIKQSQIIKAQQQTIQGQSAQLAKYSAIENEKSEAKRSENYSQEIAARLKGKEDQIKEKRFSHMFSMRHFFNKCGTEKKPTKFGLSIDVTDKDDSTTFGKFGDMLIADNGYILITDRNGDILAYAKNFTDLIWKPDGLVNYMRRNRIPLALDENMNSVPDLEEEEHSDVMYDPDNNEYAETEMRKRTVKTMLIEKNEIINDLQRKFERSESIVIQMTQNFNSTKRALRLLENRADLSSAESSGIVEKYMQMENRMGEIQSSNSKLTELKAHHETLLTNKQSIIDKVLLALEKHGDKSMYDKVKTEIKDDALFYSGILPQEKVFEKEPETKETVQTGGRLP